MNAVFSTTWWQQKKILNLGPWINELRHIQSLNNTTLSIPQKAGQRVSVWLTSVPANRTWWRTLKVSPIPTVCSCTVVQWGRLGRKQVCFISRFTEQMELHLYHCDPATVRWNISTSILLDRDRTLCAVQMAEHLWWCYTPLLNCEIHTWCWRSALTCTSQRLTESWHKGTVTFTFTPMVKQYHCVIPSGTYASIFGYVAT